MCCNHLVSSSLFFPCKIILSLDNSFLKGVESSLEVGVGAAADKAPTGRRLSRCEPPETEGHWGSSPSLTHTRAKD